MRVNLLKKGEKLTDFGWGIARKKPIEIHYREVIPNKNLNGLDRSEVIHTREGIIQGYPNKDYIICGVRGELYPIGKDIFHETYDIIVSTKRREE
jgi:hypothetical protein